MEKKTLNLRDLKIKNTRYIQILEHILENSDKDSNRVQASYAISRLIGNHIKILEVGDIDRRIKKLEKALKERDNEAGN